MKINLSGDELNTWGYDRDNGAGAAEAAINAMKQTNDTNSETIQGIHEVGREAATPAAINMLSAGREMTECDFIALGKQKDHITLSDSVMSMVAKMSEGNIGATKVLMDMLDHEGFMSILSLDTNKLYGHRIWELYKLCGQDMDRFLYHIDMELPNQATGQLFITGPYCGEVDTDAHFAARKYGKPGSFWALENPPTDTKYAYPIRIGVQGQIEVAKKVTPVPTFSAKDLQELTKNLDGMKNPRARKGFLDSAYASAASGHTGFTADAINGFRILLCRYGFNSHALKLADPKYAA